MGYLGNPVVRNFTSTTSVQTLSGDGSTAYSFIIFLKQITNDQNTPGANSIQPSMMTSFNGVYQNLQTVSATTTIASTDNAFLAGPVNFTGTVTVEGNLTVV